MRNRIVWAVFTTRTQCWLFQSTKPFVKTRLRNAIVVSLLKHTAHVHTQNANKKQCRDTVIAMYPITSFEEQSLENITPCGEWRT